MNRALRLLQVVLLIAAGLAGAGGAAKAHAQQITNVAQARWSVSGQPQIADSNPVALTVKKPQAEVTVYRPDPAGQTITDYRLPACDMRAATVSLIAVPASSSIHASATSVVRAGDLMLFMIDAPVANSDPDQVNSLTVTVTTSAGDRETMTVYETGPDSGRFGGAIRTRSAPPAVVAGDCALSIGAGDTVTIDAAAGGIPLGKVTVGVIADDDGLVFNSADGSPVSGATVRLVNAITGQPAIVYAADGTTAWPASVVTGSAVTDASGATYQLQPGEYRFPHPAPGTYRLVVDPPAPYVAPSKASAAQLSPLTRPGGAALKIGPGSYANPVALDGGAVAIDIPVDEPPTPLTISKSASVGEAAPGDALLYTVTVANKSSHAVRGVTVSDELPVQMRLRPGSVRIDGARTDAAAIAADGRHLSVALDQIGAGSTQRVTYAVTVLPDARDGQALNLASVTDGFGQVSRTQAAVTITRETIAGRMTLIGRITDGGCTVDRAHARGVANVRVMLEDGSYAVTDRDGRYHFEGLLPGSHVVQVDPASLAPGADFVDCTRSTRSAGSAVSRFVEGQGGTVEVADFHVSGNAATAAPVADDPAIPTPVSDAEASGAKRDWFAGGSATIAWLYPEVDANPRAPAVRVAIRHLPGQKLTLFSDGKPVDPISSDGSRTDASNTFAVSLWRGVPLDGDVTHLSVEVRNADGSLATRLARDVHFTQTAAQAIFVPEKSRLIADGVHRPVVAVRLVDRAGRPLHSGSVGDFALSQPYEPAIAIDAEQARALSGLERAKPVWRVAGDDGIAYIQLAPTTTSGSLSLGFTFRDRDLSRTQTIDAWLEPGQRDWTIVGLAEGGVGLKVLRDHVDPLGRTGKHLLENGRVAFYAKGQILGKWLLTIAYDSAKRREDQRLTGEIDPNTYYTVYADRSERRFDAASTRKLYVKLETRQFYALFGDFTTGFDQTVLGRYLRTATGVKAEFRSRHVAAQAFAARIATGHRRDEIQGNGLSGPYALTARAIVANTEQVRIEVRDRYRQEQIVETRDLTRFVDYDIDYAAGTLRFSSPVLSRDSAFNPQFIVVDYETNPDATGGPVNAGGRATVTLANGKVRLGATAIHDAGTSGKTDLVAADARIALGTQTEVRAEVSASRHDGKNKAAWLAEVEHHDRRLDVRGYAQQIDDGFGIDEQNAGERGRRKLGVDARVRLTDKLSIAANAWQDDDLTSPARERVIKTALEYRAHATELRLGVTHAETRAADGQDAQSTLIDAGASQRLLHDRLTVDAAASFAVGEAGSTEFPATYRLGARFAVNQAVTLVGSYEIARGGDIAANTARIGFDLKPWAGAKFTTSLGDQDLPEYGRRMFAAYGLAQSLPLGKHWTIDATLDGSHTFRGIDPAKLANPLEPAPSGGYVGTVGSGIVSEDFTAVTLGGTYRAEAWSATGRAEYRFGELGDRSALTFGAIRRLGEGSAIGLLGTWSRAEVTGGATTGTFDLAASAAMRPAFSPFAVLAKLEWRHDSVTNATVGAAAPVTGSILTVNGDARSSRVIGSVSADWAPQGGDAEGNNYQRSEVSVFLGARYVSNRIDNFDLAGFTAMAGVDARVGLNDKVDVGVSATVRGEVGKGNYSYAIGPTVTVSPARNMVVTLGYNVRGFADHDFAEMRSTHAGPFVSAKIKFDQGSFGFLGLGRR